MYYLLLLRVAYILICKQKQMFLRNNLFNSKL